MTMTIQVRTVFDDPGSFTGRHRFAVMGALLLGDEEFLIFQAHETEFDERIFMRIDDPLAADRVRATLPPPPAGKWWYFGLALVESWTHRVAGAWALAEVISITLLEAGGEEGSLRIKIRPHPWGWDRIR